MPHRPLPHRHFYVQGNWINQATLLSQVQGYCATDGVKRSTEWQEALDVFDLGGYHVAYCEGNSALSWVRLQSQKGYTSSSADVHGRPVNGAPVFNIRLRYHCPPFAPPAVPDGSPTGDFAAYKLSDGTIFSLADYPLSCSGDRDVIQAFALANHGPYINFESYCVTVATPSNTLTCTPRRYTPWTDDQGGAISALNYHELHCEWTGGGG